MDARKRSYAFVGCFIVVGVATIGVGLVMTFAAPPDSWTQVLALIASVIICGPFQMHVGRNPGFPLVGIAVVMLAIQSVEASPYLDVSIWAIGLLISQIFARRNLYHALYLTGLSTTSALAFVAVKSSLLSLGVWLLPTFLVATASYYLVFLLGEAARQWGRTSIDRSFEIRALSFPKLGFVVAVVAVIATIMTYVDAAVIPWLERDPSTSLTPFVILLAASLMYILAQGRRYARNEARLTAVVDAAVELPRRTGDDLADALRERTQVIVQANDVVIRDTPPERNEIGAAVHLGTGTTEYVVAKRNAGHANFAREDERAVVALAHAASEAARRHTEVDLLERRANSDALTGLPNYGAFQKALVEANENRPYREGIALLFIDLDNFKKLNDNFGHRAGDELLRAVAQRLQEAAGGGDFVSRVGGDEFVIIFSGLVSLEQAKEASDRIIEFVSRPLALEGHDLRPMLSAGLAFSSHRELDAQTLVEDADRTMLQSKRSRRQGGQSNDSRVSISSHRSSRTNEIVARAIRNDRLMVAFQPIVNIPENRVWAHEALVRYVDPELGPISPPSLVARAKSLRMMNELTRQMITKSLAAAAEFQTIAPEVKCITVNLELGQISDSELGPFIRESARAYPDISLCIELNERSLRGVTDQLRKDAVALQDAGVIIALDDYGSDDSSVGALVHFPMNILKIDKSLIDDLDDLRQREVVKSLQGFGDNLDYTTVVEGIETAAMVDIMTELGVQNAQGYYFGRPVSRVQSADRLRRFGDQATVRP